MKISILNLRTGGLSKPSKMPGYGYSLPAAKCRIGSALRRAPNSVCSKCYACKGRYTFPGVKKCLTRRWRSVIYNKQWVEDMTELIRRKDKVGYFRWHDSGDLQSLEHLKAICAIACNLPNIKFWMPTKEHLLVVEYLLEGNIVPKNLIIRLSSFYIGSMPEDSITDAQIKTCTTGVDGASGGHQCTAYKRGGKCGKCRACWSPAVGNVNYKLH